jgi:hypothetical protein
MDWSGIEMEAASFFGISEIIFQSTGCHIPRYLEFIRDFVTCFGNNKVLNVSL